MSKRAFKRRLKVLEQNLKDELASEDASDLYIEDLISEITKVKRHIEQYEYAEQNPIVMVDKDN